jgi:hypothetical protein
VKKNISRMLGLSCFLVLLMAGAAFAVELSITNSMGQAITEFYISSSNSSWGSNLLSEPWPSGTSRNFSTSHSSVYLKAILQDGTVRELEKAISTDDVRQIVLSKDGANVETGGGCSAWSGGALGLLALAGLAVLKRRG